MTDLLAAWPISNTWERHLHTAGAHLGGVDHPMPVGTALPILDGELEWVTPSTPRAQRPAWYNTGLGNAAAYRRHDGTRTVYGHCSRHDGRQVYSGNTGKSTGPHVHAHDVLADGTTRARPFSTITTDPEEDDMNPKVIFRTDGHDEWMLVAPWLTGPTPMERGYLVTTDRTTGVAWARLYARGDGGEHARVDRAGYIAMQDQARHLHQAWTSTQPGTIDAGALLDELAARLKA